MTGDGKAHLREATLIRILAALEIARETIDTLTKELIKRDEHMWVGQEANALQAFHFVDDGTWLGEGGKINFPPGHYPEDVPCLEPLGKDEPADRISGVVCGEDALFVVWGGRGMRHGVAVAYAACEKHARKWGSAPGASEALES